MRIIDSFNFECKSNFDPPMVNAAIFDTPSGEIRIDRDTTYYSLEDGMLSMEWCNPYIYDSDKYGDMEYRIPAELFANATLKELEIEEDATWDCPDYYCDCISWSYFDIEEVK